MNELNKIDPGTEQKELKDAVSAQGEKEVDACDSNRLPVNTYDDYKSWCDKIREEWDVN